LKNKHVKTWTENKNATNDRPGQKNTRMTSLLLLLPARFLRHAFTSCYVEIFEQIKMDGWIKWSMIRTYLDKSIRYKTALNLASVVKSIYQQVSQTVAWINHKPGTK